MESLLRRRNRPALRPPGTGSKARHQLPLFECGWGLLPFGGEGKASAGAWGCRLFEEEGKASAGALKDFGRVRFCHSIILQPILVISTFSYHPRSYHRLVSTCPPSAPTFSLNLPRTSPPLNTHAPYPAMAPPEGPTHWSAFGRTAPDSGSRPRTPYRVQAPLHTPPFRRPPHSHQKTAPAVDRRLEADREGRRLFPRHTGKSPGASVSKGGTPYRPPLRPEPPRADQILPPDPPRRPRIPQAPFFPYFWGASQK